MNQNFEPVPLAQVSIHGGFWGQRQRQLRETVIMDQYRKIDGRGQFKAFRLQWVKGVDPVPHFFWDSDVYKWLEAASYSLALEFDAGLDGIIDDVIRLIEGAQQPDGYINLYYTMIEPEKKWTDLMDTHELYCAGHLIEAAVAHYRATGKRSLLDIACRFADLMDRKLGPEPGKRRGYDGHQEVELALYKLYEATGVEAYLKLARFFITERGARPLYYAQEYEERGNVPQFAEYRLQNKIADWREYYQVHKPVLEQDEVVGHAVRVMYFCSGMADIARETKDERLWAVCKRLWANLTTRRMYITGGSGNSHHNEGFTRDYDLPNDTAYGETCAAIGLVFWSHRMLQAELDAQYADTLERALYNGALSGIALDGRSYFYMNPLASDGAYHRAPWQGCACCPPNLARLIGSIGQYVYSVSGQQIAVHLYMQNEAWLEMDGRRVGISQTTDYPWDGRAELCIRPERETEFALKLRLPSWLERPVVTVNGERVELAGAVRAGYAEIRRLWRDGDRIVLDGSMPVKRCYSHPGIDGNIGKVALQRGPIVYCFESVDQPVHALDRIYLSASAQIGAAVDQDLLGGVVKLTGTAYTLSEDEWGDELYRAAPPSLAAAAFTAVPYYAWDNREGGQMRVWMNELRESPVGRSF